MKLRFCILLSTAIALSLLSGCKASPPQVAGKWQGDTTLSMTYTPQGGGSSRTEKNAVGFALLLSQNGQTVAGNATITVGGNSINLPVMAGAVTPKGRLFLEGEKTVLFTTAHFSFNGKAESGKLDGMLHFSMSDLHNGADSHGAVTMTPAQ